MLAVERWIKKHPEWFDQTRVEIEEGHEGWRQLIDDALEAVEKVLFTYPDKYFRIVQVKEKFGGLRIYFRVNGLPLEASVRLSEIMTNAGARSQNICEIYGASARLGLNCTIYSVRCEACAPDGWKAVVISADHSERR
jgi:hypothetical protein